MAKKKKKKFPWLLIIIIIVVAFFVWKYAKPDTEEETSYKTTPLTKMDIESIVSTTGTLAALGTVEVGTQVSGEIDEILVDYNDEVKQGDVLAKLDRTTLELTYREAEASLARAQSAYELQLEQFENDSKLYEKGLISEFEYKSSENSLVSSRSTLTSAEISLEKADKNLNEYAIITSPVDGVVISREIEEGQTVQASMSAPTLFIMAEDLHQMEIDALVDESDIGLIEEGQIIRFTVEAYDDDEFSGEVKQVRMQPTTVSDVVHYTVVCSADNSSGKLLPGMTATVEFVIEYKEQVTAVTNSALSIKMPVSVMQQMQEHRQKSGDKERSGRRMGQMSGGMNNMDDIARLWYLDSNGDLGIALARKGLSDGVHTEIKLLKELPEGAEIITKVSTTEETASMPQRQEGMMRPGGPGLF